MKNKLYFLIFILSTSLGHSQESKLITDYTYSIQLKTHPIVTTVNSKLISNGVLSHYEMDFVGNFNLVEEQAGENGGSILAIKPKKNPIIYKDSKTRHIYSIERVGMKPFLVKDSMNIFNWKIKNEKKDILGYSCQQATTEYRGRQYTAYFTTEIPFQTGPWKFYGLPGLILQVESDDGVLKLMANAINMKNEEVTIKNPLISLKLNPMSWDDYIKEYEKKYKELQSYRGPNGGTRSIPKQKIETLIYPESILLKDY